MGSSKRKRRIPMLGMPDKETLKVYAPRGNYRKIQTKYSTRIETRRVVLLWGSSFLGKALLGIIGQLRSHVKRRAKAGLIERVDWTPRYSRTAKWRRKSQSCEIDLTAAYTSAALKIGAIELWMYKKLMTLHKKTRLVAVGSLGTQRLITTFRKGKLARSKKEEEETRWVWLSIVAEVDRTMSALMEEAGSDFRYYWFDAIFVRKGSERRIQEKAKALGYGTKKVYVLTRRNHSEFKTSDGRNFPVMRLGGIESPIPQAPRVHRPLVGRATQ